MSDTQYASLESGDDQSIDDQRDTATGGLTNDMPGLPTQPSSGPGPRPPSALGGLAAAVQRMMGGGPAPRPAGPGRSPWDAPGQSQIPQGPPGGPQSTQNPSRWQGTTASLGLPRGSMQPQANFTPFMRSPPTTSHTQWGQEEMFPQLPQSFETPSLYGNISKFFGQNGSASIIPLALSMGKNGAAFLDGIMKGQEWSAKMHRQKLRDDADELAARQQKEMYEYYDIVNEYGTAAGAKSGEAAKNYSINGETMLDALANKATELGDDKLLAILGTGSVDKALQFLHERNDNWRTLDKTNKAAEKQDQQDRDEQATFGQTFGGGQAGGQPARSPADTYAGSPDQPRPSSAIPQGGAAPRMPVDSDPNVQSKAPTTTPEDVPWANDQPNVQQAERLAATGRGVKWEDKRANDYINNQAMKMQDWVERNIIKNPKIGPDIIDKDGNLISSPTADALDRYVGGNWADDSTGLTYYKSGLGGGQTGGGGGGGPEQNYNALQKALAQKRRPGDPAKGQHGWEQRNYDLVTNFDKNNPINQTVGKITNVATGGRQLQEAIDDLPASLTKVDPKTGQSKMSAWAQAQANVQGGAFTGDPQFYAVWQAWNNYNINKNVLIRGGVGGQGETREAQNIVPPIFARPEDFRISLVQDAQEAYQSAARLKKKYRDIGGQGDPPGWDDQSFDEVKRLANLDPHHNAQVGDTVDTPMGKAIWRGVYDDDGRVIPVNKRYDPVEPIQ